MATLLQRHPCNDSRSSAALRCDLDVPAEQARPLAHAGVSETVAAAVPSGIKANPVVANRQLQPASFGGKGNFDDTGLGVADDVAQRFLSHPEDADGGVSRKRIGQIVHLHFHSDGFSAGETLTLASQGISQTEILQNGRVELIRQGMNVFAQSGQALTYAR